MNAFLGVGYLRRLMDIFVFDKIGANMATTPAKSSHELEKLAVAAFNASRGNVIRAQEKARALGKNPAEFAAVESHLPSITREYVQRVARIKPRILLMTIPALINLSCRKQVGTRNAASRSVLTLTAD